MKASELRKVIEECLKEHWSAQDSRPFLNEVMKRCGKLRKDKLIRIVREMSFKRNCEHDLLVAFSMELARQRDASGH